MSQENIALSLSSLERRGHKLCLLYFSSFFIYMKTDKKSLHEGKLICLGWFQSSNLEHPQRLCF